MDADHQRVMPLVFLHHLEGTGLIGITAIKRITQEQQYRLVGSKLSRLIYRMAETSLLTLIHIAQALADAQDMVLILLCFRTQLAQMLLG